MPLSLQVLLLGVATLAILTFIFADAAGDIVDGFGWDNDDER